jgi:hypothetical protein
MRKKDKPQSQAVKVLIKGLYLKKKQVYQSLPKFTPKANNDKKTLPKSREGLSAKSINY